MILRGGISCLFLLWLSAQLSTALSPVILTNHIYQNQTLAKNLSWVDPALFLNVTSYSGFFTVDDRYNANMFFWYFPVANKPLDETPWIIWLQGGPGGSSLIGLFDEMGPFLFDGSLKLREDSWCKDYSMVFIDNPVGAGFSYTEDEAGYARNMETYSQHLFVFLEQLMMLFPELNKAPLYIAGESYAGRYVPAFASAIIDGRKLRGNLNANLKGIIMGNPVMDREDIANRTEQYYRWGLIDLQGVKAAKPLQDEFSRLVQQGIEKSDAAIAASDKLSNYLDHLSAQQNAFNVLKEYKFTEKFEEFIDIPEIRAAIHVGEMRFEYMNSKAKNYLIPEFLRRVSSKVEQILEHYDVLIYCGELDLVAPCGQNSEARRRKWHWSMREMFLKAPRTPWSFNETIVGYVKKGGRFTEVSITGSGHMVPMEKPAEMRQLISYFIRGLDLPTPSNYEPHPKDTPSLDEPEAKTKPNASEVVPKKVEKFNSKFEMNPGLLASVSINVVLGIVVILGLILYVRRKMRANNFYRTVDNLSDEIFLS